MVEYGLEFTNLRKFPRSWIYVNTFDSTTVRNNQFFYCHDPECMYSIQQDNFQFLSRHRIDVKIALQFNNVLVENIIMEVNKFEG